MGLQLPYRIARLLPRRRGANPVPSVPDNGGGAVESGLPGATRRTIEFDGAQAAIGLDWYTEQTASRIAATVERQARQETGIGTAVDLKLVRKAGLDGKWQAALGRRAYGHKPGMPAAAAIMAAAFPNNELQAWVSLPDMQPVNPASATQGADARSARPAAIWILRLSDGAVLEDRFYTDLQEAGRFFADLPRGSNTKVFATPDLERILLVDSDAFPFENVSARRAPPGTKLQRLDQQVRMRRYLLAGIAASALFYVGYEYALDYWDGMRAKELHRERIANIKPPPPPWLGKPNPVNAVRACQFAAMIRHIRIPGWKLRDLACETDKAPFQVRLNFSRQGAGYPSDLEFVLRQFFKVSPAIVIDQIGTLISVTIPLQGQDGARALPPDVRAGVAGQRPLSLDILDFTSSLGIREGIRFQSVPVPVPPRPSEEIDWPLYPDALQVDVNTRLDIDLWRPLIARPGFVLNSLVRDENTRSWIFSGLIYSPAIITPGRRRL